MEQGDSTEQSPEIQLGCMRGLGGSEQPIPSKSEACIILRSPVVPLKA